jgi:hypothetical protein
MSDDAPTLTLPDADALDLILGEQEALDGDIAHNPEASAELLAPTRVESQAEIPALAGLQYKRRVLARALAPVAALFEGGQTPPAEAKRKQHRQMIGTLIASEKGITGDKVESMLERLANADPRHIDFCAQLDAMRERYYLGRVALLDLNEQIRSREEHHRTHNAELRAGLSGVGA